MTKRTIQIYQRDNYNNVHTYNYPQHSITVDEANWPHAVEEARLYLRYRRLQDTRLNTQQTNAFAHEDTLPAEPYITNYEVFELKPVDLS